MKSSSTDSSDPTAAGPAAESSARDASRYLAVLLAGLLAGLCGAELLLRLYIVPVIDSRANRVHVVYNAHNPDVVLGDSHLYRSFLRNHDFENLARPGSSPGALEIVAREYFRRLDPDRVILQASPQLFSPTLHREGRQLHDRWFRLNVGLPFVPYVFEPGIVRELAALADWDGLRHRTDVALGRTVLDGPHVRKEAARRRALDPDALREAGETRARQNRPTARFEDQPGFAAYSRMLAFLVERGARVCMLTTAVDDAYLAAAAQDPLHRRADAALRQLAAAHGVRFVDFRDLGLEFDVADFTNADHLTTAAGVRFSDRAIEACFGTGDPERSPEGSDPGPAPDGTRR
jgi:hypothetical protein